jgi:predicted CoA-binding protein
MTNAQPGITTAVLGASPNEERYSFKAVRMLREYGFIPVPVHPAGHTVDGVTGLKSLSEIETDIDTLTVYVNSNISDKEYDNIIKLNPRRVIFNPGAENWALAKRLNDKGIDVVHACTLVMLRTNRF